MVVGTIGDQENEGRSSSSRRSHAIFYYGTEQWLSSASRRAPRSRHVHARRHASLRDERRPFHRLRITAFRLLMKTNN